MLGLALQQARKPSEDPCQIGLKMLSTGARKSAHHQVLAHRQKGENLAAFGHQHHATARHLVWVLPVDGLALVVDAALERVDHPGNRVEQRGLASAVGPEHGHDTARLHLQIDALDGIDGAVPGLQVLDGEHRCWGGHGLRPPGRRLSRPDHPALRPGCQAPAPAPCSCTTHGRQPQTPATCRVRP